jgi:PAS domain S-box-containing protein
MMQTFTIDDHGQGMEKALALLREHGYSVTEPGYPSEHLSRFTQFAVQHAFVQVFWITADSRFLYVNDSACRSLGFTREELMQMSVADIDPVFPNKESREFAEGWQALREKRSLRLETFHRSRDGRVYPVEIHANLIEFEGQEYNCAFVMDITERKKAERELKLMRFVIDKASISVFRGHEDGRVLYANEHAARVLGYTVEELTSMTFFDFCPLINEKWWKEHRRLLRAQGCRKVEGVHRRKDGCIIPVETTISYVEFEGEPFSCSFSQDISDRRRAEAALTESEKKFRSLAETSPNAIVVIQKGRIVYANPAATEISGFSVEQLSGLDFWNLIHHDFRNIAHHRLLARQRGETVSNRQEYRIVTSCGEDRWVMATSAMIDFESMPAVLVTLVDISEVKLAEEALRESEARLRLAMEMAKLVQWEYDGATRLFSFDDQFYTLYGTSAVEEGGCSCPLNPTSGGSCTRTTQRS